MKYSLWNYLATFWGLNVGGAIWLRLAHVYLPWLFKFFNQSECLKLEYAFIGLAQNLSNGKNSNNIPGLSPKHTIYAFFNLYLSFELECEKNENKQKEAEIGPFFKKNNILF